MTKGAVHVLTIVAVEDLPRARAFYSRAFGWPLAVDSPVYAELGLPSGMRLGLYERVAFGRNTGRVPARIPQGDLAPTELYFHVERLEESTQRLQGAGARELSPRQPRDWGDEAAYFADPDGNVLVLARKLRPREAQPAECAVEIQQAAYNDHEAIASLLRGFALPVPDESDQPVPMLVGREAGRVIGCVGWERGGAHALLRSLAVYPGRQRAGVGRRLANEALRLLRAAGVEQAWLLTGEASVFFARLGFEKVERCTLPDELRASRQVSMDCCARAACMRRAT